MSQEVYQDDGILTRTEKSIMLGLGVAGGVGAAFVTKHLEAAPIILGAGAGKVIFDISKHRVAKAVHAIQKGYEK